MKGDLEKESMHNHWRRAGANFSVWLLGYLLLAPVLYLVS